MNSAETCTAVIKCNCLQFHAHTRSLAAEFQRARCLSAMEPPAPSTGPRPMLARSVGWISIRTPGAEARGRCCSDSSGGEGPRVRPGQAVNYLLRALSKDSLFQMPLDFLPAVLILGPPALTPSLVHSEHSCVSRQGRNRASC